MSKYEITRKLAYLRSKRGEYLSILHYKANYSEAFKNSVRLLLEEVEAGIKENMYILQNYDFYQNKWRSKENEKVFSEKLFYC